MLSWQKILSHLRTIISYGIFGGMGALLDLCVFKFLCGLGSNYLFANGIGYVLGTLMSFFLNYNFTFKVRDRLFKRVMLFYMAALMGFVTSMFFLYVFVTIGDMKPICAKLVTLVAVFIVQYGFNRLVTFKITYEGK